jgi:hypothetical protein
MSHARHEDSGDEYEAMQLQETDARHSAAESPSLHAAAPSESVPEPMSESSAPPPPPVDAHDVGHGPNPAEETATSSTEKPSTDASSAVMSKPMLRFAQAVTKPQFQATLLAGKVTSIWERSLAPDIEPGSSIATVDFTKLEEMSKDACNLEPELPIGAIVKVITLVLSMAAMMSAATAFIGGIPTARQSQFGGARFTAVTIIMVFGPMLFSPMVLIIYNTYMSEKAFYVLLRRKVLIDFPDSTAVSDLVRNLYPCLFIVVALTYLCFSLWAFIYFGAELGIWIIFFKQFLIEICLFWWEMQTVEDKLVSLPKFIESCDDRKDDPKIDVYTVERAASLLKSFRPVSTRASYKAFTAKYAMKRDKTKYIVRLLIFIVVGGLCGLAYLSYKQDEAAQEKDQWKSAVAPCVEVCFQKIHRDASRCSDCVCACTTAVGAQFDSGFCNAVLVIPGCDVPAVCSGSNLGSCFARPGGD